MPICCPRFFFLAFFKTIHKWQKSVIAQNSVTGSLKAVWFSFVCPLSPFITHKPAILNSIYCLDIVDVCIVWVHVCVCTSVDTLLITPICLSFSVMASINHVIFSEEIRHWAPRSLCRSPRIVSFSLWSSRSPASPTHMPSLSSSSPLPPFHSFSSHVSHTSASPSSSSLPLKTAPHPLFQGLWWNRLIEPCCLRGLFVYQALWS